MALWRSSSRSSRPSRGPLTRRRAWPPPAGGAGACPAPGRGPVMPGPPRARRCSRVPAARRRCLLGAPGGQLARRAVEDDLALVHERDLRTGGADVLDQVGADTTTVARWPSSRSRARNFTRCSGSSPAVGSSSSSSSGSLTIACAMPTRRSIPPDRVRSFALALPPRSTRSTAAATARGTRAGRHLLQQREVLDELRHREARVVAEVLRQVPEPAPDLAPRAVGARVPAEQPQPAGGRRDHGGHHAQQRGLARAVRAEQPEHPGTGLAGPPRPRPGSGRTAWSDR